MPPPEGNSNYLPALLKLSGAILSVLSALMTLENICILEIHLEFVDATDKCSMHIIEETFVNAEGLSSVAAIV